MNPINTDYHLAINRSKHERQAIKFLTEIGYFIRVSDLDLYHGRVRAEGENGEWQVDANFNNAGDTTGHGNINGIPALHTASKRVAETVANNRNRNSSITEVHKIVSSDENAIIYNQAFDITKLSEEDREKFFDSIVAISTFESSTELAPVKRTERKKSQIFLKEINDYLAKTEVKFGLLSEVDIENIWKKLAESKDAYIYSTDKQLLLNLAGSINVIYIMQEHPEFMPALTKLYIVGGNVIRSTPSKFSIPSPVGFTYDINRLRLNNSFPIDPEFLANFLKHMGIIGIKTKVTSDIANGIIDDYILIDLEKVNTEAAVGAKHKQLIDEYDTFASKISEVSYNFVISRMFERAKPQELINYVSRMGFKEPLDKSAGVWEGFTIAQHTETCLRFMQDNFKGLPQDIYSVMKLAILCHDIGKGVAKEKGIREKSKEEEITIQISKKMFEALQIVPSVQDIALFIATEAQHYTTDYFIRKNENALETLNQRAKEVLKPAFGEEPNDSMVKGLVNCCVIMQTTDSAAYTKYSSTRDEKTGIFYSNANESFAENFIKEGSHYRLKKPSEK